MITWQTATKQGSPYENDHKYKFIYHLICLIYYVYFDKHICVGNVPTFSAENEQWNDFLNCTTAECKPSNVKFKIV